MQQSAMSIATSKVFAFQEMGPLQHFYMALVDFEGRAESDGQPGQYVTTLHQKKRLPINFLQKREKNLIRITLGFLKICFEYLTQRHHSSVLNSATGTVQN